MKIETYVDSYGAPSFILKSESSHEAALLQVMQQKGISHTYVSEFASCSTVGGESGASMTISFYANPLPAKQP